MLLVLGSPFFSPFRLLRSTVVLLAWRRRRLSMPFYYLCVILVVVLACVQVRLSSSYYVVCDTDGCRCLVVVGSDLALMMRVII